MVRPEVFTRCVDRITPWVAWAAIVLGVVTSCTTFVEPDPCDGPIVITVYETGLHVVERPCREPCEVDWGGYKDPNLALILCGVR